MLNLKGYIIFVCIKLSVFFISKEIKTIELETIGEDDWRGSSLTKDLIFDLRFCKKIINDYLEENKGKIKLNNYIRLQNIVTKIDKKISYCLK